MILDGFPKFKWLPGPVLFPRWNSSSQGSSLPSDLVPDTLQFFGSSDARKEPLTGFQKSLLPPTATWCCFYCPCHENKWDESPKLSFMLKIHRLMVRILLPTRKGSGKEHRNLKGKEKTQYLLFFVLRWKWTLSSHDKPPFDLPLGIKRDKQLDVLHLLLKFKVKSTANQLLVCITLVREPATPVTSWFYLSAFRRTPPNPL